MSKKLQNSESWNGSFHCFCTFFKLNPIIASVNPSIYKNNLRTYQSCTKFRQLNCFVNINSFWFQKYIILQFLKCILNYYFRQKIIYVCAFQNSNVLTRFWNVSHYKLKMNFEISVIEYKISNSIHTIMWITYSFKKRPKIIIWMVLRILS